MKTIYEKIFEKLKHIETEIKELIQELETEKISKKDIDKVRLIVSKLQSAKAQFDDK